MEVLSIYISTVIWVYDLIDLGLYLVRYWSLRLTMEDFQLISEENVGIGTLQLYLKKPLTVQATIDEQSGHLIII